MPSLILSFGFKHGAPPDTPHILDVRNVRPNPYSTISLRNLNGLDQEVQNFLEASPLFQADYAAVKKRVQAAYGDGEVVAVGCHGGKHRSVYIAEKLGSELDCIVEHRDLPRSEQAKSTRQLFKIQRPISIANGDPTALVYNFSRSITAQLPWTAELAHLFGDFDLKVYYEGHLENHELVVTKRVFEQKW